MSEKQNPAPTGSSKNNKCGFNLTPTEVKPLRKSTKIYRVLKGLADRSYNRFEAERLLADHCLPSTVSAIQSLGVVVARKDETVSGYQGSPTKCCRYWVEADQMPRVSALLGLQLEAARGAK